MLEQYGVSRESLREGLRLLEAQGLISIRRGPGGGPIVGRVDPANFGRMSTLFYHLVGATYEELFEAWVVTEATLAERAARNEDRALVREAMEPFLEAPDHDMASSSVAEFVAAHSQFHAVVASLAGNRVLQLMLQTIGQIVTHHVAVNADPRDAETDIDRDHVEVARAIAAGRPAKARSRMEEHIRLIGDFYKGEIGARHGRVHRVAMTAGDVEPDPRAVTATARARRSPRAGHQGLGARRPTALPSPSR